MSKARRQCSATEFCAGVEGATVTLAESFEAEISTTIFVTFSSGFGLLVLVTPSGAIKVVQYYAPPIEEKVAEPEYFQPVLPGMAPHLEGDD